MDPTEKIKLFAQLASESLEQSGANDEWEVYIFARQSTVGSDGNRIGLHFSNALWTKGQDLQTLYDGILNLMLVKALIPGWEDGSKTPQEIFTEKQLLNMLIDKSGFMKEVFDLYVKVQI
jgi:hypothetical protein